MVTNRRSQPVARTSLRPRRGLLAAGTVCGALCLVTLAVWQPSPRTLRGAVNRLYAADSFWNIPIAPSAEIDANSDAEVSASFARYASRAGFSNGAYGIPMAYASAGDKVYTIACTGDAEQCNGRKTFRFPIPAASKPATGSDRHLSVIYTAEDGSPYAGKELDMWDSHYDSGSDAWSAQGVNILDLYGSGVCQPTPAQRAAGQHCLSSVASGVAALGGVVRPEEIAQGHIDHALAIAVPRVLAGYLACPATHTDGRSAAPAVPEGARVQLDPSIDVGAQDWPRWVKLIAVALQRYGGIVVDYSDVLVVKGVSDQNAGVPSWTSVGVPVDQYDNLSLLPWNRMRVLAIRRCP